MSFKDEKMNHIDGNILLLTLSYSDLNRCWIDEINIDGDCFDYDSQDRYYHVVDKMHSTFELIEKINPETKKKKRQILLEDLSKSVNENIRLYENHKNLFQDLPRKKLLIKEFKERKYSESTKNDKSLYDIFIHLKEIQNRNVYFKSELYKNIGFLEHNYHEEIYNFARYIQNQIDKNFENFYRYDSNYLVVHDIIFFNMGIVYHIHDTFCGVAFEEITELELYKALNFLNTIPYLKIKNTKKLLFILHNLSELLDENYRRQWLKGILKEIQITKDVYDSKYKAVVWKSRSSDQKKFANQYDTLFKEKIAPLVS